MIPTYIPTPNSSANAKNAAAQNSKTISATLRIRFKLPNLRFRLALTPPDEQCETLNIVPWWGFYYVNFSRLRWRELGTKEKFSCFLGRMLMLRLCPPGPYLMSFPNPRSITDVCVDRADRYGQ